METRGETGSPRVRCYFFSQQAAQAAASLQHAAQLSLQHAPHLLWSWPECVLQPVKRPAVTTAAATINEPISFMFYPFVGVKLAGARPRFTRPQIHGFTSLPHSNMAAPKNGLRNGPSS